MALRDLSHTVESGMAVFPDDPPVSITPHATVPESGYRVSSIECGSHSGTHVDAPSHTEADGRDVDEFKIDRFALEAIRVDLRGIGQRERIRQSEIPAVDADILVLQTGWDRYWTDRTYFDHPFLTPAAAERCVEEGYDVAIDALNVDPTPTDNAAADEPEGFQAHHHLLGSDQLIIENLTDLEGLPERFELLAFPIKLAEGDGAPIRAAARYET